MIRWLGPWVCALLLWACDSNTLTLVRDPDSAPSERDAGGAPPLDASTPPDATVPPLDASGMSDSATLPAEPAARCGKRACACDDGSDNDGDGLADGLDPECTGAYDDDESSFATGKTPGPKSCRDCYWDGNSGSGDDSCRYPEACLTGAAVSGNGNCRSCDVVPTCVDRCGASTPNGCDCFGCCELSLGSGSTLTIELSETCSLAALDDATACPRCVQNTACRNPCGRCELCPGRTQEEIPADCAAGSAPGAPPYRCDEGQPVCRATSDCPVDMYCQLGCCLAALL